MGSETMSEKVSVNINSATLSQIDLLVDYGYFSNRSDFINQALREGLDRRQSTLDRVVDQETERTKGNPSIWFMGLFGLTKADIDAALERGRPQSITGYGVLKIDEKIEDEALFAVIEKISVKGKVICKQSVKEHYGLKQASK